jgi:hypothetical protein
VVSGIGMSVLVNPHRRELVEVSVSRAVMLAGESFRTDHEIEER